jgi:hypothetical protein
MLSAVSVELANTLELVLVLGSTTCSNSRAFSVEVIVKDPRSRVILLEVLMSRFL